MDSNHLATVVTTAVLRNRRGSATIEYAMLIGVIGLVAMIGLGPFGGSLANEFSALSRTHWLGSESAAAPNECRRVEWVDPAASQHLSR